MRIIRFKDPSGNIHYGSEAAVGEDAEILGGELLSGLNPTGDKARVAKLLYPYSPTAIHGIGANFKAIFEDAGKPLPEYPVVFFKYHNALQHPSEPIILPRKMIRAEQVKFEGELGIVVGKTAKNVPVEEAMDYVFGYTIANDVSASDWQRERVGNQWCKGKGFDTFLPFGPVIVTKDEITEPGGLRIVTKVDGKVEQDDVVANMCFDVAQIIAFLSAGLTVPAGTLIIPGTPTGARFMVSGETVEITIEPIGTLTNQAIEEV